MQRRFVLGLVLAIGLGSAVVTSASAGLLGQLYGSIQTDLSAVLFGPEAVKEEDVLAIPRTKRAADPVETSKAEVPQAILWRAFFDFTQKLESKVIEAKGRGEDGKFFQEYFVGRIGVSHDGDAILKSTAETANRAISSIDEKAKALIEKRRLKLGKGKSFQSIPEVQALKKDRDSAVMRYRDELRTSIGDEAFSNVESFLFNEFSRSAAPGSFTDSWTGNIIFYYPFSLILYNDTSQPPLVSGYSELYFEYWEPVYQRYDPSIDSLLYNTTLQYPLEIGTSTGYQDWVPAQVGHSTFASIPGNQYCVITDHYAVLYDGPFPFETRYLESTADCHVVAPPVPTPTPDPCDPASFGECQTPTPTPAPTVSITPIEVVEKFGTTDLTINIQNNSSGSTRFTLTTTTGTGSATFVENGTNEILINGNTTPNQTLKIKGVTESSQLNNIRIEARMNGSSTVSAQDDFTVAVITSLEFERYDATYLDLDANPGNGQPNTNVGKRIYPDKKDVADVSTGTADRSLVKVKANVLPATADLKVYFGSFDMDDPSATGSPIDTTGPDGGDNNGPVKAGDFVITTGNNCADEIPNEVSRIECPTVSDGSATAVFKTTMQPGDNFSIAASVDRAYRNGITVNSADGSRLRNQGNKEIVISGAANPDKVAGIRTEMLTVWRKLHIEIDSMGPVSDNFVEGTFTENRKVGTGTKTLDVNVSTPLEPDRFENGRMVINGRSYHVIDATASATANTVDSVTIRVLTVFNITPTTTFRLYDDDDMDDNDGGFTTLKGDQGDDVPEPDISFLNENDDPALNYLASAYIRPAYDLAQSHENVPFVANIEATTLGQLDPYLSAPNFDNIGGEALSNFWTIYLLGAYQLTLASDGDPRSLGTGINFGATYGASNVSDTPPHSTNGFGSIVFTEVGRPNEYPADYASRPVSRAHTTVHEVGHLFGCIHGEGGLMEVTQIRTGGTFSETSLSWIRKAEHP